MRPISRIEPALPVHGYKTYQIAAPVSTHFKVVTCIEADCPNYYRGWLVKADENSELGKNQANYIRTSSGRKFTEHKDETGLTVFEFYPEQRCFRVHNMRIDRPEIFIVKDGDWRGNPTGRIHQFNRPSDWVDSFAGDQQRLLARLERG